MDLFEIAVRVLLALVIIGIVFVIATDRDFFKYNPEEDDIQEGDSRTWQ